MKKWYYVSKTSKPLSRTKFRADGRVFSDEEVEAEEESSKRRTIVSLSMATVSWVWGREASCGGKAREEKGSGGLAGCVAVGAAGRGGGAREREASVLAGSGEARGDCGVGVGRRLRGSAGGGVGCGGGGEGG